MRSIGLASKLVLSLSLSLSFLAAACGDDKGEPVSVSDQVGIELKADSDKVVGGTVSDEKNINTEEGNPYGAFVNDAVGQIGHDPSAIDVDSVALLVGAGSDVTALNQVFDGQVEVLFQMTTSNDTIPVAAGIVSVDTQG